MKMIKHIYSEDDHTLIEKVEASPTCEDFCDSCGDCLSCCWEDPCRERDDGKHYWVEYRKTTARFID